MYEEANSFWDITIVLVVIVLALAYLYRRMLKKGRGCGGCSSCCSGSADVDDNKKENGS
ncbi:hypothetical protein CSW98_02960 [Vibrio sp. HA2012]|uniref:FeoB-associated Cys-rich membrane protein n=1 Tax=Vibrio sp. HA2012 TaxID=1971595 RepID=UPI000C2B6648|nr:hypothetical protein CSW98_02960 [Vibrio sp. HA2012]